MTQLAQMDLSNAPRDLEELKRKGRFQLRQLAENLGIISDKDPQAKLAFMSFDTEKQATEILSALKARDNATNGAGHATAAPAAAEPPKTGFKRTPSNKGATAAEAPASASTTSSAAPFSITPMMEALKAFDHKLDSILSNQAVIIEKLGEVSVLAALSTSTALLVGETTLNAPRADIMGEALNDVPTVTKEALELVGKGKK